MTPGLSSGATAADRPCRSLCGTERRCAEGAATAALRNAGCVPVRSAVLSRRPQAVASSMSLQSETIAPCGPCNLQRRVWEGLRLRRGAGIASEPPATQGNPRPYTLHDRERPGASQCPVDRRSGARKSKNKDPGGRTVFKRVGEQHRGNGRRPKERQSVHRSRFPRSEVPTSV